MEAATLDHLPGWAFELLERGRVAHLGLVDDHDRPRVLPVTFALVGGLLCTAIDQKPKRTAEPARLRYLRRRPAAALTVDRYADDWSELAWVQALGLIEEVRAGDAQDELAALAAKYEPYRLEAPPGPVLLLRPSRFLYWSAAPV